LSSEEHFLRVRDLHVTYAPRGASIPAVRGVDLDLHPGETLGLAGESGCGKSSMAAALLRLLPKGTNVTGEVLLDGEDVLKMKPGRLRAVRWTDLAIVFQGALHTLNPVQRVGDQIGEAIRLHSKNGRGKVSTRVGELLELVGLPARRSRDYPHELSGGQRQRVGLARSLSVSPDLLIADEPVSALDVSVQASVLNLLRDLQKELGFSCLFISHDLATVEFLCDRVAVMYLGKIVELAPRDELFARPQHPYTQALLSAAVVPDPEIQRTRTRVVLEGDIPSPIEPPSGCRFRTRCPLERESAPRSTDEEPPLVDVTGGGHFVACHLVRRGTEAPRLTESPVELAGAPE
jgi:oligopeptide/dipeptide ABC transporter ATP-binding protein